MEKYRLSEPDENGVRVITYDAYRDRTELCHAFSTRFGGVSRGIYESMNLGFNRGDEEARVRENYRRLFACLGIPEGAAVLSRQTHSVCVRRVTAAEKGVGLTKAFPYDEADGLVSDETGVALVIFTADCVPVYLYDPKRHAIGLCHAGWRGTVGRIASVTLERMRAEFRTDPRDVIAVIGPSIGPECFEVGEEVASVFDEAFGRGRVTIRTEGRKPHVDLWRANALCLTEAGVPEESVQISGLCTMCRPELLFSHRASAGRRGSNIAVMMLKDSDFDSKYADKEDHSES